MATSFIYGPLVLTSQVPKAEQALRDTGMRHARIFYDHKVFLNFRSPQDLEQARRKLTLLGIPYQEQQ